MFDPTGALSGIGYSGFANGKNNPVLQDIHNTGPIPVGVYTLKPPIDSPMHGDYAIPLEPVVTNQMFGRSLFLIHGDSRVHPGDASRGCIIVAYKVRVAMWESNDHVLKVIE